MVSALFAHDACSINGHEKNTNEGKEKKMKIKRKMIVLVAAIVFTMCGCLSVNAQVRNSGNTYFEKFSVSPQGYNTIGYRTKEDSSPAYLYYDKDSNARYNT